MKRFPNFLDAAFAVMFIALALLAWGVLLYVAFASFGDAS